VDRTSLCVSIIELRIPRPCRNRTTTNVDPPKSRVSSDQVEPTQCPPFHSIHFSITLTKPSPSPIQCLKSPKPPKPTAAEPRQNILADVTFPQSNPFNLRYCIMIVRLQEELGKRRRRRINWIWRRNNVTPIESSVSRLG